MKRSFRHIIPMVCAVVLSVLATVASAQSRDRNYVCEWEAIEGSTEAPPPYSDLSRMTVTYFDGMGRKISTVRAGASEGVFDIARFTTPDPLAEKYPWLSPYNHCANNPLKIVDPNGKWFETVWDVGNLIYDVAAAAYYHAVGDHESAKSHWVDAGADFVAAVTPLVPAGVTKATKITKAIPANSPKTVHGNSKMSSKAQHAYDIVDIKENKVVKTGVSGGKIRKDGKSVRAESQVRKWNKEEKTDKYESNITQKEPAGENARDKILKYEEQRAKGLRKDGHLNDDTKHNRP